MKKTESFNTEVIPRDDLEWTVGEISISVGNSGQASAMPLLVISEKNSKENFCHMLVKLGLE